MALETFNEQGSFLGLLPVSDVEFTSSENLSFLGLWATISPQEVVLASGLVTAQFTIKKSSASFVIKKSGASFVIKKPGTTIQ